MSILPKKNELGFYEIRLESIGGLGANLAGKMLAEAGVLGLGLNGSNFSSYGSEKKGTPVKSFVRFSDPDVEIRDHSPIEQPHVIGVFHEALRSEEHTSELQSRENLVCRLLLEKKRMRLEEHTTELQSGEHLGY